VKYHRIINEIGIRKIGIVGAGVTLINFILSLIFNYPSVLVLIIALIACLLILNVVALKNTELNWVEKMEATKAKLVFESIAYSIAIITICWVLYQGMSK